MWASVSVHRTDFKKKKQSINQTKKTPNPINQPQTLNGLIVVVIFATVNLDLWSDSDMRLGFISAGQTCASWLSSVLCCCGRWPAVQFLVRQLWSSNVGLEGPAITCGCQAGWGARGWSCSLSCVGRLLGLFFSRWKRSLTWVHFYFKWKVLNSSPKGFFSSTLKFIATAKLCSEAWISIFFLFLFRIVTGFSVWMFKSVWWKLCIFA